MSKIAMIKGDKEKAINYMKVAVELDSKVYIQLQKDPIFVSIRNKIEKPKEITKEIEKEENKNISMNKRKEKNVYIHLLKMNMLIENLSNEDIEMIKNNKIKKKIQEKEEKEK